ncbi:MAG TPA: hypothetical protein VLF71_00530 [Candidatus Saccharimonadales bacterium]|nr:hypothetical protein [Candidatus Saccharimonadales bacterium]
MKSISRLRKETVLIIIVSVVVAASWLLVPAPPGAVDRTLYSPFGTPTTLMDLVLAIGSGLLFLQALKNFKQELKPAYRLVACAQLSVGLLTLFFPYIEYYDLWSNNWLNMASYLPYLVGSVLMYFGARQFMKTVGLSSRLTAPWLMLAVTLLLWGVHAVIPHYNTWTGFNERQYDWFEVVTIVPVLFYAAAGYIMLKIRHAIGLDYRKSFGWLGIGLLLQMGAAVTVMVMDITGYENWYFASRAYEFPIILGDIGVLCAAYQFNAIGLSTVGSGLGRLFGRRKEAVTSLDIITYVAGMASNPRTIDPVLDKVRTISAELTPGKPLTAGEEDALRAVYLQLEQHLVAGDPLRSFTKESLRSTVGRHFGLEAGSSATFWGRLA